MEKRWNFDICKQDSVVIEPGSAKSPAKKKPTENSPEEFKRFLLACIWEKRIPKSEILMMNLVQNIRTLNQAVEDDTIPLKQALKILMGLQKVYQRRMAYLFEDSQYVLNQLMAPFSAEGVKGESNDVQVTKTN